MKNGLTFLELLIIVSIIIILGFIVIPGYIGIQKREKRTAVIAQAKSLKQELQTMLKVIYSQNPKTKSIKIDWNGDGKIDNKDTIPYPFPDNAEKLVTHISTKWKPTKYNNPYGPENIFKAGIIQLFPDNNSKSIVIKAFDNKGNLVYSETAFPEE